MTHHDPLTAVHLTLERGDPWLAVFILGFLALCAGFAIYIRIKPGLEQLRQWDRENGR